ncbi:MAG TPA: hypothetical protein VMS55_04465 [Myxococcota bacterium]|nr:hypothetical protein [Myxococcota bacterium]
MSSPLPNVGEILGRLLARVPEPEHPLFVAIAERMAATRYRGWAKAAPAQRERLLACSEREEEIARRVESLHADAASRQQRIRTQVPELAEINESVFAGRPLDEQFAIQAQGERVGAGFWRSLAGPAASEHARRTYLECAGLEEQNATALESLRRGRGAE